eukprot:4136810-Amphidinium_carterae.1
MVDVDEEANPQTHQSTIGRVAHASVHWHQESERRLLAGACYVQTRLGPRDSCGPTPHAMDLHTLDAGPVGTRIAL